MNTEAPTFNLAIVESSKQMRFDPLRHVDPERLTRALDLFRAGRLRELALIIEAQEERDDVLAAVVPKTKAAVARHGYEICVNERVPAGLEKLAERQKEALEHFYNQLRVTNALDQDEVGGVSLLLRQMMDAKSKRYAVHNLVFRPGALPTATLWFTPLWFFENSTGKMRFIESAFGTDGVEMPRAEWLVTKGTGVGIACAVAWMFKHLSLRDWVSYNYRCGKPGMEGITDAQPGTPQWQNMVNAVASAASDFRWVRNRTDEIKPIDFGAQGELPFAPLVERMDRAMATLWRGGDLGTMSKASQAVGSNPQESETALLEQDDAQWLGETLNFGLDRLVLDYVCGEDAPALAYFKVLGAPAADTKADLEVDTFLLAAGHPISREQAAERYSRPLPEEDAELLTVGEVPSNKGQVTRIEPGQPAALRAGGRSPYGPEAAEPLADKSKIENQKSAINEALGSAVALTARATAQAASAEAAILRPILQRMAAIEVLTDPEAQRAALANLAADWPWLARQALGQSPALAAVLEQAAATAFASGLAERSTK